MAATGGNIAVTNRPRALAVLIAVFLVGCIAGAFGSYYWLKKDRNVRGRHEENGPPPPQGHPRLPELLQLTPAQDARSKEIMAETRKQLEALRTDQAPTIEAIWADTNRKFLAILNPEQQKKFNAFLKEREEMRYRMPRDRDGFRPPP
jgi:Spy/CpxP family protein refolding chaperone